MTRPRAEIMRDLHAILAELEHSQQAASLDTRPIVPRHDDISPKLKDALDQTRAVPIQSHEDIRAKARAYKEEIQPDEINRPEKKERLKDYTPADDPDWDDSVFLGSGDRQPRD